jgi:3-hydroxyacyl-CoA dehydrogenase
MLYADQVGVFNVLRAVRAYAARAASDYGYQGRVWEPAALLVQLARGDAGFNRSES